MTANQKMTGCGLGNSCCFSGAVQAESACREIGLSKKHNQAAAVIFLLHPAIQAAGQTDTPQHGTNARLKETESDRSPRSAVLGPRLLHRERPRAGAPPSTPGPPQQISPARNNSTCST
jgi:hypothetical protein